MSVDKAPGHLEKFMERVEKNLVARDEVVEFLKTRQVNRLDVNETIKFIQLLFKSYQRRELLQSTAAVNLVGTGGGVSTFNISTTAAFVTAAAGSTVIKSGSHSYTSQCGALNLLSELGINTSLSFEHFSNIVRQVGIGFVNPALYPPVLRRMAITIMPESFKSLGGYINTIGPLLAPVHSGSYLIGVNALELVHLLADIFCGLRLGRAIVCWSEMGMDEFCSSGKNYYKIVDKDQVSPLRIYKANPESADVFSLDDLKGGTPAENAAITRSILDGSCKGPKLHTVLLNSAFAMLACKKVDTVEAGLALAAESVISGQALRKMQTVSEASRQVVAGERIYVS